MQQRRWVLPSPDAARLLDDAYERSKRVTLIFFVRRDRSFHGYATMVTTAFKGGSSGRNWCIEVRCEALCQLAFEQAGDLKDSMSGT
eukprot:jgi/Bigna1/59737/fgenesh1_kg.6_\